MRAFLWLVLFAAGTLVLPANAGTDPRLQAKSFNNIGPLTFRNAYPAMASLLIRGHVVPGLDDHFVPQGIDYVGEDSERAVISGYFCENLMRQAWHRGFTRACVMKHSAFYLYNLVEGRAERLALLDGQDGKPLRWHAGGVAVLFDRLWLPDNFKLLRFNLAELLDAEAEVISMAPENRRRIGVDSSGDFISAHDGVLWVGNFQRAGRGAPLPAHYLSLEEGTAGWTAGYRIDPDTLRPVNRESYEVVWAGETYEVYRPDTALHHRNLVQGITFIDARRFVLSTSWGDSPSAFTFHRLPAPPLDGPKGGPMVTLPDGSEIPIWAADSLSREFIVHAPPGSEGIAYDGEALLTIFEGGAMPYRERWRQVEDRLMRFLPPGVTRIRDERPAAADHNSQ